MTHQCRHSLTAIMVGGAHPTKLLAHPTGRQLLYMATLRLLQLFHKINQPMIVLFLRKQPVGFFLARLRQLLA